MFDPVSLPVEASPAIQPVERLCALAEVVLCSGFPTQVVILSGMSAFGMQLHSTDGSWSPLFVAVLSLLDTVLVVGLVVTFLRSHRERVGDVLIGNRRVRREVLEGVALLPVVFLLANIILAIILTVAPQLHNVPENPMQDLMRNPRDAAVFGVVVMLAAGVREEVQRGFIVHRFGQYLGGGAVGVVVHSVIFGLGHVDQGWDAAIAVGTLGGIWGTIYLVRRSIIAPMVSHAGFNLAQIVKFIALQ